MRQITLAGMLLIVGMVGCSQPPEQKKDSLPVVGEGQAAATSKPTQVQGPIDQSATKATIVLSDGLTIELHDFALYTSHRSPMSYIVMDKSARDEELALKIERFWHVVQLDRLKSLQRQPNQNPKDRHWLGVSLTLTSGEQLSGRLPLVCDVTWLACSGFEFAGKASALGVTGDFIIEGRELQSIIAQGSGGRYDIKDRSGKVTSVHGLTYRAYSQPPVPYLEEFAFTRVFEGGRRTSYGQPFKVIIGKTEVAIKLEQIESMIFPKILEDSIHFRMRSGEEADGRFSDDDRVERAFGKTTNGLVFFEELASWERRTWLVKSITFGSLAVAK